MISAQKLEPPSRVQRGLLRGGLQVSRWTAEQEDIVSWKFINMHWVWQHSAIVSNVVKGFVAERNLSIHQQ